MERDISSNDIKVVDRGIEEAHPYINEIRAVAYYSATSQPTNQPGSQAANQPCIDIDVASTTFEHRACGQEPVTWIRTSKTS